jgi:predicted kinase
MRDCPQDAIFHAEGDVWTHVGMVCQALASFEEFRALPEMERQILFAAALLHDVAKPLCTRHEDGRITSRGHSQRGAIMTRRILWESGVDFVTREQVCAMVRYHQSPFHLINRPDAERTVHLMSQSARCDLLSLLARADAEGRQCADKDSLLTHIELFCELCREEGCFDKPKQFPSAHSRFLYFRTPGRDPDYLAHEAPRCEVTVMSGLPASGKDTWIARHLPDLPQVSLDAIRTELETAPARNQGLVVQVAREKAREFLRAGRNFVWNATNLSREIRTQVIDLFAAYEARVKVVYVETSHAALYEQNRTRDSVVPPSAIERMLDRWEVPGRTEGHEVEWWVDAGQREDR